MNTSQLSPELRQIVKWSVGILGEVIENELGPAGYRQIETVRKRMTGIRGASHTITAAQLEKTYLELSSMTSPQRRNFARAYTLMLELMNACENAYRTYRLKLRRTESENGGPDAIYYVLTAHPTEARAPANIAVFHEIQVELTLALQHGPKRSEERLRALIQLAWKIPIVRLRKPRVQDEAEHIYSVLLRDENLSVLLDLGRALVPIYIRSWVGGDKDGHPGVDEKTMLDSLQLSRTLLHDYTRNLIQSLITLLDLGNSKAPCKFARQLLHLLQPVREISSGDAKKIRKIHQKIHSLKIAYEKELGIELPGALSRLVQLFEVFPGLVVPLELREDSTLLMSDPTGDSLAIGRMLKRVGELSHGENPCWYVRGMIISMTQSAEHIQTAVKMIQRKTGSSLIPVVPLFEQKAALDSSAGILQSLLKKPEFRKMVRTQWSGILEVMVGYSDSAKESGVISSRLAVLDAMLAVDKVCRTYKVQAAFFHGSGGSVDRGGGAIQDQMSGWPMSALRIYKATLQGEMVERTFASGEILESQLLQIIKNAHPNHAKNKAIPHSSDLEEFARKVKTRYQSSIGSSRFLKMVENATPYRYLSALKIGSRPTKRAGTLSVPSLRAIPWVLCWTQTRVLFPTWWGVGTAWKNSNGSEKQALRRAFVHHPVFRSYLHALGFTLAKIELPIWEFYLSSSSLEEEEKEFFKLEFRNELRETQKFFEAITGKKDPLWFRPWLGTSIELRAPMIHPLNLLEIIAQKTKDLPLLRVTVTGIASGMMTTG